MKIVNITSHGAAAMADSLRRIADMLERGGPRAYVSGAITIDHRNDTAATPLSDHVVQRDLGLAYVEVVADLVLRPNLNAPPGGVKTHTERASGVQLRWDGKPMRAPRKGEWYRVKTRFLNASSNFKSPHWIYEEV